MGHVADRVVLVNGLPASGKTTLGAELAAELDWVFLSKDVVVDALAVQVWPHVDSGLLGGIALDAVYALGGAISGGVVIDSIWLSTRDRSYLAAGLAAMGEPRFVEVWCEVPEGLARERFEARMPSRHPLHGAWCPGFWDHALPITEHPIRVDTTTTVDVQSLVRMIQTAVGD
jgi:glucokinase